MKLNSKGQVTIPANLRHSHNLLVGDEIDVVEEGGVLQIIRAGGETRGRSAVRRVRGILGRGLSTDEVMALTRGE